MKVSVYILSLVMVMCANLQAENFKIGIASSLQKIRNDRIGIEKLSYQDNVYVDIAKDESESFQLVVVPQGKDIEGLKVVCSAPELAGNSLDMKWHIVGYVKTANPSYPVEYVGLWPDPLMPAAAVSVAADKVQPLWFSVVTAPDTAAGIYKGSIELSSGENVQTVSLVVNVRNFTIPRPGTLAAPFGLYKWTIEEWYYGKRDTLKPDDYKRWCRFLAEYRLTPKEIGVEFVERKFEDAADPSRLTGVDMSVLEPIIDELSEKYFPPYSMQLYRLPSGPTVETGLKNKADWCTPENISQPVKLYVDEWKKRGFSDNVYIYGIDEAVGEEMYNLLKDIYAEVKKSLPNAKIMQTGLCNQPEMVGLIDIWCPKNEIAWEPFFQERRKAGDILWMYVCCSPVPPYPNLLVDEPAIDHRVLFWQTKQIGATGFLYWSTLWHAGIEAKPYTDTPAFPDAVWDHSVTKTYTDPWVHTNGDGLLVYPGNDLQPLPSIRLEVIRDGIEDYEYMVILEKLTAQVIALPQYQANGARSLVKRAKELSEVPAYISKNASEYTTNPDDLINRRKQIADMIEQLTDILVNKDYTNWKM